MSVTAPAPSAFVRAAQDVEADTRIDGLVDRLRPLAQRLVADPRRDDLLRGAWLGHALHPLMTDVPIGCWTSAHLLDLLGGEDARPAAQRLVGIGILTAAPTALTGWAEWAVLGERKVQRVGAVHAVANVAALACYVSSWRARRKGHHRRGVAIALAGGGALGVGGFLGGHLVEARKVSSRHPVFDD
jgi:uncharacterized membrane protein